MGNTLISKILFQPPAPPNSLTYFGSNLKVSYLWIYSPDKGALIPALHVTHPPRNSSLQHSTSTCNGKYTLLYSHGNAEDLGLIAHFLTDLARLLGVDILCYDYSGYGVSTDKVAVSCFLREYGAELEAWKAAREIRRERGGDALLNEESIFVAPMVHPKTLDGILDEFDFVDDGDVDDGNSSCFGSCDGDAGLMYGHREEEEDDGGYFANACGVATYEYKTDNKVLETRLYHRSNVQRLEENHPLPMYQSVACNITNVALVSPKVKRRNILAHHSWTPPVPSEQQCYNDIQCAFEYLTQVKKISPRYILMYGKSVGSGPTCWLAQKLCTVSPLSHDGTSSGEDREECTNYDIRHQEVPSTAPAGVILHSPFLSVIRVVLDLGFTGVGDLFPNIDRVNDLTCPVYVIHGTEDEIVPFYHGKALFDRLSDSSRVVPFWARGAGHNNIETEMPTAYIKRLHQFIRQCDRILYPQVNLATVRNEMFQLTNHTISPHMISMNRPTANRTEPILASPNNRRNPIAQEQKHANKQRKQRGTLVIKSSHNSKSQLSYHHENMTSASKNDEWQHRQKQRLLIEQRRQQQPHLVPEYLLQKSPGQGVVQYQRNYSVPIMSAQPQHTSGSMYQREY